MQLFPLIEPLDKSPSNNPVPGKAVLAETMERLGARGLDRARGLAEVSREGPRSYLGGAGSGDVYFTPREK